MRLSSEVEGFNSVFQGFLSEVVDFKLRILAFFFALLGFSVAWKSKGRAKWGALAPHFASSLYIYIH